MLGEGEETMSFILGNVSQVKFSCQKILLELRVCRGLGGGGVQGQILNFLGIWYLVVLIFLFSEWVHLSLLIEMTSATHYVHLLGGGGIVGEFV